MASRFRFIWHNTKIEPENSVARGYVCKFANLCNTAAEMNNSVTFCYDFYELYSAVNVLITAAVLIELYVNSTGKSADRDSTIWCRFKVELEINQIFY